MWPGGTEPVPGGPSWEPGDRACVVGRTPASSQGRRSQDRRGVRTTAECSAQRPRRGEDTQSYTVWGSGAESGGIAGGRRAPVAPLEAERPGERVLRGLSPCLGWGRLPSESSWPAGRRRATPRPAEGRASRPAAAEDGRLSGSERSAARAGEESFAEEAPGDP